MEKDGRWSRCWAWVRGWERTWVKVYLGEGQESRRDRVKDFRVPLRLGTMLSWALFPADRIILMENVKDQSRTQ